MMSYIWNIVKSNTIIVALAKDNEDILNSIKTITITIQLEYLDNIYRI